MEAAPGPMAFDDDSSTESEGYDALVDGQEQHADENVITHAAPSAGSTASGEDELKAETPMIPVKEELRMDGVAFSAAVKKEEVPVKLEVSLETENQAKPAPPSGTCKRCRRKLWTEPKPEQVPAGVTQVEVERKVCACCEVKLPLSRFGGQNKLPGRVIPHCRVCTASKNGSKIYNELKQNGAYKEALEREMKQREAVHGEAAKDKPVVKVARKMLQQRWEEQFEVVGGKTTRERRLLERNAAKGESKKHKQRQ